MLLAAMAADLTGGHTAHAEFDWTRGETLAPGVELVTITLTKPPEAGLTCPQYAAFDPAAPRTVAIAAARIALGPGVRFEATPRAADWGRPMPPRGEQTFPDLVIRTALQTVPAFAAAERAAGVPVVLAVNASPWEPFVPGRAFEHADRMGLVVDDGIVVSPPTGRPALVIGHDGHAALRVVAPEEDLAAIETAVSGFSFCLVDGVPSPPDQVLHPRTGFGLSADGTTLFILVADGRQAASQGLTVREVGELLREMGADDGINMDGGGSTTLVAKAAAGNELRVVNTPSGGLRRNGANLAIAVDGAPAAGRE
ncbi:MAG: phosphodiester glycosidase family protein [Planctomycetes bacterium]|nr:phosphodiester glycosidase family protein [Planctomycetota bacterium]